MSIFPSSRDETNHTRQQLKEVKKYVQDDEQDFDDDGFLEDDSEDEIVEVEQDANRPTLLFYGGRVPSKQELLADLPQREVVDRLVAKFLNSDDPSLGKLFCLNGLKDNADLP